MKGDKALELFREYPELFPKKIVIECGTGWFSVIREVCAKIEKEKITGVSFVQIKEKYGTIRMYYECANEANHKRMYDIIQAAEVKSGKTCEVCGGPGRLLTLCGCSATICEKCSGSLMR